MTIEALAKLLSNPRNMPLDIPAATFRAQQGNYAGSSLDKIYSEPIEDSAPKRWAWLRIIAKCITHELINTVCRGQICNICQQSGVFTLSTGPIAPINTSSCI